MFGISKSSYDSAPFNFEPIDSYQFGNYLAVKVRFPDCTNYEGTKIMVYENITISDLYAPSVLDPTFPNQRLYPEPGVALGIATVLIQALKPVK